MGIKLFNTLAQQLEPFQPIDLKNVKLYVCGPTVYDRPHIGNARSVVVYDILYRVLIEEYGQDRVLYIRNITDVEDKINIAAKKNNVSIQALTAEMIQYFNDDIRELNCLPPNIEPKATEHIADMVSMISALIQRKNAYIANGHVYFDVSSFENYGKLAGRNLEEMIAGSRIEISPDKQSSEDFVLWKPKNADDDPSSVFESPWGEGRPGWHIECSAMSTKYLGTDFDIHGGGIDLIFPHHTNEIAQSCACYPSSRYARYWVHNGFLTVNGEKMSKSLNNFFTVKDLLDQGIRGEVIRYVYLSTHYRKPLNWTQKSVEDAKKSLDSFYRITDSHSFHDIHNYPLDSRVKSALYNDLNTAEALGAMHNLAREYHKSSSIEEKEMLAHTLYKVGRFLGLLYIKPWFKTEDDPVIIKLVDLRSQAKQNKDWVQADKIRKELQDMGVSLEDHSDGTTRWHKQ